MSNPRNVTNLIRAQETKEVRVSLFGEALANKIYPNWIHFCYSILLAPKIQMIILRASPIIHTVGSKPSPIYDRRLHAPYRQHRFRRPAWAWCGAMDDRRTRHSALRDA
jgi:hypothetical protein